MIFCLSSHWSCSHVWHTSTHLVQLPAEALKYVMLVDFENRLALIEDGMHDHAQRVHVRGGVTADGQDVLRGQVLRVGEAEWREVGLPLFTCVLKLKRMREHYIYFVFCILKAVSLGVRRTVLKEQKSCKKPRHLRG